MKRARLIERQAYELQVEIYRDRASLWPTFQPPIVEMFQPDKAAEIIGIAYELHPELRLISRTEVAGIIDRQANKIAVAQKFGYETARFTGAHEIGHWLLHGEEVMHRDPPVRGMWAERAPRPLKEVEADYFAACFLIPARLLRQQVRGRFGTDRIVLDDISAARLGEFDAEAFLNKSRPERALMVATTSGGARFEPLARYFGVTAWTMAYRLLELDLVE